MLKYNLKDLTKAYQNGIVNKAYDGSKLVYWRTIRTIPPVVTKNWFRFRALEDCTFKMTQIVQYSLDGGYNWAVLQPNTDSPIMHSGEVICWKRNTFGGTGAIGTFSSNGHFEAMGNIQSLVVADNFDQSDDYMTERTFFGLMNGCTGLTNAENVVFPNTVIEQGNGCYGDMFRNCSSLVKAPKVLPALELKYRCYADMFNDCTSLTVAPEIKATVVANYCCSGMFSECSSLRKAPDLLASTLANSCYEVMFEDTRVNSLKCLATDISAANCTNNWLRSRYTSTGTFYAKASTNWKTNTSGIPSGWTRVNV